MYQMTNNIISDDLYKYFVINEFGQETEISELSLLAYLTNSDQYSLVDAVSRLKKGERLKVGKSDAYIERRFNSQTD